jgi:hypothetical protein
MTINALSLITAQSNRKPYKFDIPNSLRFNDDQYSRLTKIFSTAQTDTTKWTVSFWYKNAASDDMSDVYFFQSNSGTDSGFNYGEIGVSYGPNNVGIWNEYTVNNPWSLNNGNKFRDINWYHFVYSYDESETNAIDRLKQYINGVRSTVTASLGSGPSSSYQCDWCKQNYYTAIGKAYTGIQHPSHSPYPFRGYMAEFHSFDGVVLEPSEFGRTDKYGNWVPKKVINTNYGNNGFYLDFSDVTDIGADRSGNNNHFTPSGFDTTITTDTVTNIATSTGTDYLSGASYSGTWISTADQTVNPPRAFDGSLVSYFVGPCAATTGQSQSCNNSSRATSTVTLGTSITVSSSLRVYYRGLAGNTHYGGNLYFKINGTQYGTGSGGPRWETVPGVTSITSIGIEGSNQSDNCCAAASFYAIEVDGVILKSNDTEYTLTFNTGTSISSFSRGDIVYQSPSVYGTVLSVDSGNKKITLGLVTGTFVTDKTVYKSIAEQDNYFNYDYMNDSPTNNYATWNTLTPYVTTSRGGLNITNQRNCTTTFGKFKTGKYYFEWNATQAGYIGVTDNIDSWGDDTTPFAHSDDSLGYYAANQSLYRNSSTGVVYGPVIQSGTLAMAVDFDNGTIEYFHNGGSLGYATTVTSALTSGKEYYIAGQGLDTTNDIKTNFGQQPFRHTPPVGFLGLHKKTLPAKKFIDGTDHFRTILGSDFKKGPITDKEVISGANWTYTDLYTSGTIPDQFILDTSLNNLNSGNLIGTYSAIVEHRYEFEFDPPIPSSSIRWTRAGDLGFSDGDAIVTKADDSTVNITASEVPYSPTIGTTSTNYDIKKVFIRNRSVSGGASTANYVYFSITDTNGNKKIFYNERFKLKFNNSNNFNLFPVRSIVSTSQDATARGIVTEVDTANNTITVGVTTGNFNVGDDLALFKSQIISASQETFPSGLWWIKDRENSNQHQLVDSVRGNTIASQTPSSTKNTTYVPPTGNSVAWCWNSANPELSGFNIIEYTGDANATQAIAHGLPGTPEFIITGSQGATPGGYETFHVGCTPGKSLTIDSPAAEQTDTRYSGVDATNITYGSDYNTNGQLMIAYAWTSVPGYSAFGTYYGNSSADGPVVLTGFKPAFILYKSTSSSNWHIRDTTRSESNPAEHTLYPNLTNAEPALANAGNYVDLLSNGFKLRNADGDQNMSGQTYIYAAFAEKPAFAKNLSSVNAR